MKILNIRFLAIILLFSGCYKNSFLIKKRYSKGFYVHRSNNTKTGRSAYSSYSPQTKKEHIVITKHENELIPDHLSVKPSLQKQTQAFKAIAPLTLTNSNLIVIPKKTGKRLKKTNYNGNSNSNTNYFISGITLLIVLAMIVTLAKVFGLLFIYTTCFIIAFTAISAFFIIRAHIN